MFLALLYIYKSRLKATLYKWVKQVSQSWRIYKVVCNLGCLYSLLIKGKVRFQFWDQFCKFFWTSLYMVTRQNGYICVKMGAHSTWSLCKYFWASTAATFFGSSLLLFPSMTDERNERRYLFPHSIDFLFLSPIDRVAAEGSRIRSRRRNQPTAQTFWVSDNKDHRPLCKMRAGERGLRIRGDLPLNWLIVTMVTIIFHSNAGLNRQCICLTSDI